MNQEELLKQMYEATLLGNAPVVLELTNAGLAMGLTPEILLFDRECSRVERSNGRRSLDNAYFALSARSVAAASGVDGDPIPTGGVEEKDVGRYANPLSRRFEDQIESSPWSRSDF